MKVSLNWLKDWIDLDIAPDALADRLTLAGLEVDSVVDLAAGLQGIVVAEILETHAHPNADRLKVCRVRAGAEEATIVCGAPNAEAGLKAPLATLGTVMPNGLTIQAAKLRGVASEGMLCSATELGLGEGVAASAGLMALPSDAPAGMELAEYLGLNDVVLDLDLTPNRADCLSIRGVAREAAALTGAPYREPEIEPVDPAIEATIGVQVLAPQKCPHYVARVIQGVDATAPTPPWMIRRLQSLGLRSLGPIVDVTNYVLLELGQPMHAFDCDALEGPISVRCATDGEELELLDGQRIELSPDCLVIADTRAPIALAGIMGGLATAVSDKTVNVVLESAWFNPSAITGRGRRFGLSTDSSHRFERGVDPELQVSAIERATQLIMEIAGGTPGPVHRMVSEECLPTRTWVELSLRELNQLLGTDFDMSLVERALEPLGMTLRRISNDVIEALPPSARRDVTQSVDLIEEIARMIGYDQLPSQTPQGVIQLKMPPETVLPVSRLRGHLASRGFQEVIGWSFISKDEVAPDGEPLNGLLLANPLTQEQSLMRPMLWPGLLDIAKRNSRHGQPDQRLFEVGRCFSQDGEFEALGILMLGRQQPEHFDSSARPVDFYDLKGEIEQLFGALQVEMPQFESANGHAWLHPAQSATLMRHGKPIGFLGCLHPTMAERYDLKTDCFLCQIEWAGLSNTQLPKYVPPSKYQASRRDLAIVLATSIEAEDVLAVVREAGGPLLESCVLFDQYQGAGVEKGCKSLGIGLIIRDNSRTLTDNDLDALSMTVLGRLKVAFNAKLRG